MGHALKDYLQSYRGVSVMTKTLEFIYRGAKYTKKIKV
jgi:hypothetical protein